MNFLRYHPDRQPVTNAAVGQSSRSWNFQLYGGMALLILLLLAIAGSAGMSFGVFTQDPMALAQGEPYFGLLSNVGILFWSAAATVCFFVASLGQKIERQPSRHFFILSGLFTLLLLLDDLFLLHEAVLPRLLGIRQRYVLLIYLLLALLYLANYGKVILSSHPLLMAGALALFGLSLAEDLLALAPEGWHYLLEDGAKLFGIISWFNYFALVCRKEVKRCIFSSPG